MPRSGGSTALKRGDVDRERGALSAAAARAASSLSRTLPDRYSGGRDEPAGAGVVVDELAERGAGVVGSSSPSSSRDVLEVDAAVGLQADREGVVGGVGAERGVRGATTRW